MELQYIKVEKQQKPRTHDCHYNEGCRCDRKTCYSCGWNPKVAEIRAAQLQKQMISGKGQYRLIVEHLEGEGD